MRNETARRTVIGSGYGLVFGALAGMVSAVAIAVGFAVPVMLDGGQFGAAIWVLVIVSLFGSVIGGALGAIVGSVTGALLGGTGFHPHAAPMAAVLGVIVPTLFGLNIAADPFSDPQLADVVEVGAVFLAAAVACGFIGYKAGSLFAKAMARSIGDHHVSTNPGPPAAPLPVTERTPSRVGS